MIGTVSEMTHFVSTVYGESKKGYGIIRLPLQGILQGNGAGPAIWLFISIPIITSQGEEEGEKRVLM